MASSTERAILRDQVRTLIHELEEEDSYLAADNLVDHAKSLFSMAQGHFGKDDVDNLVTQFYDKCLAYPPYDEWSLRKAKNQVKQLRASMRSLLRYLNSKIGDPVAAELLSDNMALARDALESKHLVCAVFLCRLTLEQTLKRICEKEQLDYKQRDGPTALCSKLKDEGVLSRHLAEEVNSKIMFENDVVHLKEAHKQVGEEEARILVDWTQRFVELHLS